MSKSDGKESMYYYAELLAVLKSSFFLLGVAFAAIVWVIDPIIDAVFLGEGTIVQRLFYPDTHAVYMRSIISAVFIIYSFIASSFLQRFKQVEASLKSSEQRFRNLYDENPAILFTVDEIGTVLSLNQFGVEELGYPKDQLIGQSVLNVFYEEDRFLAQENLKQCFEEPDKVHKWEIKKVCQDGSIMWVRETGRLVEDVDGKTSVMIVCEDITEHNQAKKDLRNLTEQLINNQKTLFDLAKSDYSDEEQPFKRIFESDAKQLQVARVSIWLYNHDHTEMTCQALYQEGETSRKEAITMKAEQYPRYFHSLEQSSMISASDARSDPRTNEATEDYLIPLGITSMLDVPIRLQGKMVGIVCHEHIGLKRKWSVEDEDFASSIADLCALVMSSAKRKKLEEQLHNSQRMESIGQLAGGLAHDFNNLLAIMQSNFEFLEDFNTSKDDDFQKWVDKGYASVKRGASLTRRLLNFSRADAVGTEVVDINKTITEFKELFEKSLTPEITVTFNLSEDEPSININADEFQDALVNLTLNAKDAMPEGGTLMISTSGKVMNGEDIKAYPGLEVGPYVCISVSDTGHGMDKTVLEKVLDPFFTTKEKSKGTGLGLSMVYGFVKRNKGYITLDSKVGRGTTVQLYLPSLADKN